jgi:TfoX/Sxy family transcriptional regulator of competence genes
MAYDERLAERLRTEFSRRKIAFDERKMFGGLAIMVRGNMTIGVMRDELMVRTGPDAHADALARKHTRPMDFTGRPMKGMVYVAPAGLCSIADLRSWVDIALAFNGALPAK